METDNQASFASQARIIKRYSNRKLYDTADSRYVTLQQIGEMVRQGEDVKIIDNKTKEDKTEATLALIISEDLKSKSRSVPLGTLRTLIQERGERLLSQLREGPIGRLIPGAGEEDEPEPAADGAAAVPAEAGKKVASGGGEEPAISAPAQPAKRRLNEIVDASRHTLDQLQATLDERVRAIVPGLMLIRELRDQVEQLKQRVEKLEASLVADAARSADGTSQDDS